MNLSCSPHLTKVLIVNDQLQHNFLYKEAFKQKLKSGSPGGMFLDKILKDEEFSVNFFKNWAFTGHHTLLDNSVKCYNQNKVTVFPAPFGPTINVNGFWNSITVGTLWE